MLGLLNATGRNGKVPDVIAKVLVVFIPKPTEGERPIGLLPTLHRVTIRPLDKDLSDWETQHSHKSIVGGNGSVPADMVGACSSAVDA